MIWILRDLHRTHKKKKVERAQIGYEKLSSIFLLFAIFFLPPDRHPSSPGWLVTLSSTWWKKCKFSPISLPLVWWFLFHHTRWSFSFSWASLLSPFNWKNIFCCFCRMVGSIDRRWRCAYDVYTWNMYTDDFNRVQWVVLKPPNRDEIRSFFGFIGFPSASRTSRRITLASDQSTVKNVINFSLSSSWLLPAGSVSNRYWKNSIHQLEKSPSRGCERKLMRNLQIFNLNWKWEFISEGSKIDTLVTIRIEKQKGSNFGGKIAQFMHTWNFKMFTKKHKLHFIIFTISSL